MIRKNCNLKQTILRFSLKCHFILVILILHFKRVINHEHFVCKDELPKILHSCPSLCDGNITRDLCVPLKATVGHTQVEGGGGGGGGGQFRSGQAMDFFHVGHLRYTLEVVMGIA